MPILPDGLKIEHPAYGCPLKAGCPHPAIHAPLNLEKAVGSADCADDADNQELGSGVPFTCKVTSSRASGVSFLPFYLRNRRHLRIKKLPIPD